MKALLKINAETAAMLYLALLRLENSDSGSCYCDMAEAREKCADCQAREALTAADGIKREPEEDTSGTTAER